MYRRRNDGIFVFNLGKTWEKLQLAARIIVAIENPQDIIAISARPYGQRAVLKFANYAGAKSTVGRHTPGACAAGAGAVCEGEGGGIAGGTHAAGSSRGATKQSGGGGGEQACSGKLCGGWCSAGWNAA